MKVSYKCSTFIKTKLMTPVGIIEDNESLRQSVALLLETNNRYKVVLSEPTCDHIIHKLEQALPLILLMDIDMPGMNGIEGVKLVKQHFPSIDIIMFTVFENDDKIFDSIIAGADGYILKRSRPEKIVDALHELQEGGAPMSPGIAQRVMQMFRNTQAKPQTSFHLSKRELDILNGLVKGQTYKEMAGELFVSVETVRTHLKNIYEKMHVHSKAEAVVAAFKNKLFR